MTILEALGDEALFARSFPASTWSAWFAFLGALYGLPLDGEGLERSADTRGAQRLLASLRGKPGSSSVAVVANRESRRSSPSTSRASVTTRRLSHRGSAGP
jgi:hypothetical protein